MSDITAVVNRIIPITVELYDLVIEEFPDLNVVGKDDGEYKLEFTLQNKGSTAPYTVADSDLSTSDKQEIIFTSPEGKEIIRKATLLTDGTDGVIFYICQKKDMNIVGIWLVRVRVTEDDVVINYPQVPIKVE